MMEVASQTINRSKEKLCTPNVDERNESIEIMDVQIEENDLIYKMLESRIKQLEKNLKKQRKRRENLKRKLIN